MGLGSCFLFKFKYFQGKFLTHSLGPYEIENVIENGTVKIRTLDEEKVPLFVNGHWLKAYHKPVSREEIINIFQDNTYMKLVKKNSSSSLT